MQPVSDAKVLLDQLQHPVVLKRGLLVRGLEHLEPGEHQEGAKQEQDPLEGHDQCRAHANQDGPEHDDAEDAPEQHPVLVEAGNAEEGEDRGDDEDVVHRQRLLDQVAGEELEAGLGTARIPDPGAEGEGDGHVAGVEDEAFLCLDLLVALVQEAEVEDEEADHHRDEDQPEI